MSSMVPFEENNNNLGEEQRNYADDGNELISSSVLRRLDKQFQDIMLTIHQVWGPKLVEMEDRIMKLELAVDKLLVSMKSNSGHNTQNSRQRYLNLQFINKISSSIWTGDEIKGEGGNYIEVVLEDETGKVVDFGPEASAEVKIFAFKADVEDIEGHAAKTGYITDDIARDSKAKKPILAGDVCLKLNKGIGTLANIKFRNFPSHMSGVFKLRAEVVDCFDGTVIKDAKTEFFMVKDYRGKYNRKHYPPSLSDDICHLDNIGRGGSMRLKREKINTVEDFLTQLLKDSDRLKREVGLPAKKWEATVKHALTCPVDRKVYCSVDSEGNNGVVFNLVGNVLGLILERNYVTLDNLPDEAKAGASKMEIAKIVQKEGLVSFNDETSLLQRFSQPTNVLHPSNYSRSQNTIDQEGHASQVGESCLANLVTSVEDVPSTSNFAGETSVNTYHLQEFFHPSTDVLQDMDDQEFDFEALWPDSITPQNISIDDMFVESPVVSDYEVKKKLFILFTVSKWFLEFEKMAASAGNGNKKRQRIETD